MPQTDKESPRHGNNHRDRHDPFSENGGDIPGEPGYPPDDQFRAPDNTGNAHIGSVSLRDEPDE